MPRTWKRGRKAAAAILSAGMMFQLGSCDFGDVGASVTLDGRELVISLIRGAILNPIDAFITEAVNDAFGDED